MMPQIEGSRPSRRPWLVLGAALLVGFVAAGTFATSLTTALIFFFSLFVAVFLGTLAHAILAEPPASPAEQPEADGPESIGLNSV